MRNCFALGLALAFCGFMGSNCEAGQGVFAKIHRAKINLIKKVLHIGQGRATTGSAVTYSSPVTSTPVEYATPIEYAAPIEYSAPVEYASPAVEYSAPVEYSVPVSY